MQTVKFVSFVQNSTRLAKGKLETMRMRETTLKLPSCTLSSTQEALAHDLSSSMVLSNGVAQSSMLP